MSLWMTVLVVYFAVGLTLVFIGPAARQRHREQLDLERRANNQPRWKLQAFAGTLAVGIIILWPVLAISAARIERKPKTAWDALQSSPAFQEQRELFEAMSLMCADGVDADEMPNGRGEFGLVSTNPIPCKTVFGSTAYLSRLRTPNGTKVVYRRCGSVASDASSHPVDVYEISHPHGHKLATLFISPYQNRISSKSPRGFELA